MTTTIKTYVSRFHAATLKEDDAIVQRIQSVAGLSRVHGLKPADIARTLFDLPADAKLESRHTAPVSHASTVGKLTDLFGFDVVTVAKSGTPEFDAIRAAFRVSTGRVTASRLMAAAKSAAEAVTNGTPNARSAALITMVEALTKPAPRKVVTPDQRAKGGKPSEVTPANAVPTVAIPATLPELIAALESQLREVDPSKVGPYVAKLTAMINRINADRAELATKSAEKVAAAKTARAAKGTKTAK